MSVKRKYVVQYRKVGSREWLDSHNKTFPTRPSAASVKEEFLTTAEDLVSWSWYHNTPQLRGDYEVRVIKREQIEREVPIGKPKRVQNQEIIRGVQAIQS
jgi:hypothetical protein